MAHQSPLIDWLLSQKNTVDYRVTQFNWVEDYLPGYYDCGINFFNGEYKGRSVDKIQELALTKAISEGIERATCEYNKLNSSMGVAAHIDSILAEENAKLELLERISFDIHFTNKISFQKIIPIAYEAKKILEKISYQGVHLLFFQLLSPNGIKIICAVATGIHFKRPFGGIIGLGCDYDVVKAERSALFECLRNLIHFIHDEDVKSLSLIDFQKIDNPKFTDRFRLLLDLEYFSAVDFLFQSSVSFEQPFPDLKTEVRILEVHPLFHTAPIKVVQAYADYQFISDDGQFPSPVG